jgi:hypothetical protein
MFSKIILAALLIPLTLAVPASSSIDIPRTVGEPLGTWFSSPLVEICQSASTSLGTPVLDAVDIWRALGYAIDDVTAEFNIDSPCQTGNVGGYIMIQVDPTVSNPTTFLMVVDGKIAWAKIKIPGPIKERVLEHEFGHALGWPHNEIPGHIMNGSYDRGGDSYRDLRVGPRYRPPPRSFPGARGPRRGTGRD